MLLGPNIKPQNGLMIQRKYYGAIISTLFIKLYSLIKKTRIEPKHLMSGINNNQTDASIMSVNSHESNILCAITFHFHDNKKTNIKENIIF